MKENKNIKETMDFYINREKVKLNKKKGFKEMSLRDETNNLIKFELPYKKHFNTGEINIYLVDVNRFNLHRNNKVNMFLCDLVLSKGVTDNLDIYVSSEKNVLIQHEIQHTFDNFFNLKGEKWEREYRACLGELIFNKNSNESLTDFVNFLDDMKGVNNPYVKAIGEVVKNIGNEMKINKRLKKTDAQSNLRKVCLSLLNKNYVKHIGKTYYEMLYL